MPTHSRSARSVLLTSVLVALALVAAACSGSSKEATATGDGPTTTQPSGLTAPLTGLPDPDGEAASRPALSVKIDNNPDARPQNGLAEADIVWEEVVEGQATRFLAVFNSTSPEIVGPIRSVRFTDPDLVWPLGGLFVYSGGVPEAVAALNAAPVQAFDEGVLEPALFRSPDRSAPHNLYGRPAEFWKLAEDPAPPLPLLRYLDEGETFGGSTGGEDVASVTIDYGGVDGGSYVARYDWDAERGEFLRSTGGEPQFGPDGEQIGTPNLIIQFIDYNGGVGVEGAKGTVVGSAEAWVLSQGKLIRGGWSRADLDAQTEYRDAAGEIILLPPGRTWITLPQIDTEVVVEPAAPPAEATETPAG
ncbi:MAG: DUF3048 domain-containing protein [Acidimicrobiia bacterium]|nr:DUF3048 domain-containing protein [Acidimicrobiia bacterium]